MKKSYWIVMSLLIASLFLVFSNASQAAAPKTCKSIDGFVLLVDLSQSREGTFTPQQELQKKFVDALPNLEFQAAIRTFWQPYYPKPGEPTSQLVYGPTRMDKSAMQSVLASKQYQKAFTPLGPAMRASASELSKMPGKNALIILSDFEESDRFGNPVAEAEALKAKFPNLIIICVFFSDDHFGREMGKAVAEAGAGKFYEGTQLLSSTTTDQMIREIFTEPCPAPKTFSLQIEFDFDKADIRPEYHNDIKNAADFMIEHPSTSAVIEGHTDNKGTDKYNEKLSLRRADSVMNYMIEKFGISAGRLSAKGYGESRPIADNSTDAGRQKNRRVDVVISAN